MIGLGDHVPSFLLRPVPKRLRHPHEPEPSKTRLTCAKSGSFQPTPGKGDAEIRTRSAPRHRCSWNCGPARTLQAQPADWLDGPTGLVLGVGPRLRRAQSRQSLEWRRAFRQPASDGGERAGCGGLCRSQRRRGQCLAQGGLSLRVAEARSAGRVYRAGALAAFSLRLGFRRRARRAASSPSAAQSSQSLRLVIGGGREAPEGGRHRLALGVIDEGRGAGVGKGRLRLSVDLEKTSPPDSIAKHRPSA